jgi:hypothetical protein
LKLTFVFKCLIVDDRWRIKVDEMGHIDPFGSDAVHGAICHSLFGAAYLSDTVVELTLEQAGFFFPGVSFPNN